MPSMHPPPAVTAPDAASAQHLTHAREVLDFWFAPELGVPQWFGKDAKMDEKIRTRFGERIALAQAGQLRDWEKTPQGALALIILLDQFSRNIFRGEGRAFAHDAEAKRIAAHAVAQRFDLVVPLRQQGFFYLPFEHDESLTSQIASVALFEALAHRASRTVDESLAKMQVSYARKHREAILRFGRFPGRNLALGRPCTAAEEAFLQEHPEGF